MTKFRVLQTDINCISLDLIFQWQRDVSRIAELYLCIFFNNTAARNSRGAEAERWRQQALTAPLQTARPHRSTTSVQNLKCNFFPVLTMFSND